MASFSYEVQTTAGQTLRGVLTATDQTAAQRLLEELKVRVISLQLAPEEQRRLKRSLSAHDFQAFNQQLAYLTVAGLPVEQGLRLMAEDVGSGRLSQTIRAVANEMAQGASLAEAFGRHERQFPPLYGRLIAAGVQTNNLPGMLLNLGRHLELVAQMRDAIWRAVSYPLVLFVGLAGVLTLVSVWILPQFKVIFEDFRQELPSLTKLLMTVGPYVPWVAGTLVCLLFLLPFSFQILRWLGLRATANDILLPVPVLGAVLRRNILARWCDALKLAVEAGLGLPEGLLLAGDTVGSGAAQRDSKKLAEQISAGHSPAQMATQTLAILPPTVLVALQFGSEQNDLPVVLANLSEMYQQQARLRMSTVPAILTVIMLVFIAGSMMVTIAALFMPLVALIEGMTG